MIEILATCLIAAGTMFTVPEGWTAEVVGASGRADVCSGQVCFAVVVHPIDTTFVRIRRPIKAGDTVKPPSGCTVEVKSR